MANEKRLIDANDAEQFAKEHSLDAKERYTILDFLRECATVDAVEVVRIEETKQVILQTLDTLIATHRDISNSAFSEYEKHLDIPKSSNDYYGIYADTMEIARRLVNAALTDLCENCGAKLDGKSNVPRMDGDGNV